MPLCAICHLEHPKCSAHSKRTGGPCGAQPMAGQRVCKNHGGKAPAALAKAEQRIAVAEATDALHKMGVPVPVDPGDAVLALVAEAHGNVIFLRSRVQELDQLKGGPHILAALGGGGRDGRDIALRGAPKIADRTDPGNWKAAPHVLVTMYESWCDRLAQYSALALKAGVEERRLRIQESELERVYGAVLTSLNAAGLTPEQQEAFRVSLANELRRLASAGLPQRTR